MRKAFMLAAVIGSLVFPSFVSAGAHGEIASTIDSIELVYTDLHETSEVMTYLPSIIASHDNMEYFDLNVASWGLGELHDENAVLAATSDDAVVFTAYDAALLENADIRRIPRTLITEDATPNLYELMTNDAFDDYMDSDGLIAIPGLSLFTVLPTYLPVFREDWIEAVIEAVGFDLGDSPRIPLEPSGVVSFVDYSFTIDDLHRLLTAIRNSDLLEGHSAPVAGGRWIYNWPTLFGAFGLSTIGGSEGTNVTDNGIPNGVDERTGEVLPNAKTGQFRALVEMAASWYIEELLADDVMFSRKGADDLLNELLTGEVATILSLQVVRDWGRVATMARGISDDIRVVVLPPPIGRAQGTRIGGVSPANGTYMAMKSGASDDEVRAALRVLDFVKLTREGYVLEHHGIRAFEKIQDWWRSGDSIADSDDRPPFFPRYPYYLMPNMHAVAFRDASRELVSLLTNRWSWGLAPEYWIGPRGSARMRDVADVIGPAIGEEIEARFGDMITGGRDDFAGFVSRLEQLGIDDALAVTMDEGKRVNPRTWPAWPTAVWEPLFWGGE